jgi:hypothetical protein
MAADGSVESAANDIAAASTIALLRLNHDQLTELRKAVIDERILDVDLSADEADAVSRSVMATDDEGRIAEFCLAISHVATWLANRLRNVD